MILGLFMVVRDIQVSIFGLETPESVLQSKFLQDDIY